MNRDETHNTIICRNVLHFAGGVCVRSKSKSMAGSIALEDTAEGISTRFATRPSLSGERLACRLPVVFEHIDLSLML
jgi:hypothetical protein